MRYFGGKARIAKELGLFLNNQLTHGSCFVDLFAGSCNVVSNISSDVPRYVNDVNEDVIVTMRAAAEGFEFPTEVTREEYERMRTEGSPSNPLYGFMAYGCSFAGKRWGGYAQSKTRNYAQNASNSLKKKGKSLKGVNFSIGSYVDFKLPAHALVYCDIPYSNTTKYSGKAAAFNHQEFYTWVAQQTCAVLISEYETSSNPLGLDVAWRKSSKQDIRSSSGEKKDTMEVIFHKPAR